MGQLYHVKDPGTFHLVALPGYGVLTPSSHSCQPEGWKGASSWTHGHIKLQEVWEVLHASPCAQFNSRDSVTTRIIGEWILGDSLHSKQRDYLSSTWQMGRTKRWRREMLGRQNSVNQDTTVWRQLTRFRGAWVRHEGSSESWDGESEPSSVSSPQPEALFSFPS